MSDIDHVLEQVRVAERRRNERVKQAAEDYRKLVDDIERDYRLEMAAVRRPESK